MIDIDNWMRELEEEEDLEIKNNEEYQHKLFKEYVLRGSDHQEERKKLNERYLSGEELMGETLTSDSGGGSYAQSKTHDEVRHDLTVADAKALAVTIRRDIIRPLVEFNYGTDADIPFFGFDCHEVEDQKEPMYLWVM